MEKQIKKCQTFLTFFVAYINNFKIKGEIELNIALNVKSIFISDINNKDKLIELLNYKLLKIILYLENQGGGK